jgi:capsule polysaccharide export protein KpsE/RkpR
MLLIGLCLLPLFGASAGQAQTQAKTNESKAAASPTDPRMKNLDAYIDLLRKDVRQQKEEIMGSVMVLSAADAAKFWPIYSEYDKELTKLNDQRAENIKEYARTYNDLTGEKADELIQKSLAYQKQCEPRQIRAGALMEWGYPGPASFGGRTK